MMISFMVLVLRVSLRLVLCLWPRFWPRFRPRWRLLAVDLRGRPVHFLMELLAALRPAELLMRLVLHMLRRRRWLRLLLHCRLLIAAEGMLVRVCLRTYTFSIVLRGRPMVQGMLLQLSHRPAMLARLAATGALRCGFRPGLVLHGML